MTLFSLYTKKLIMGLLTALYHIIPSFWDIRRETHLHYNHLGSNFLVMNHWRILYIIIGCGYALDLMFISPKCLFSMLAWLLVDNDDFLIIDSLLSMRWARTCCVESCHTVPCQGMPCWGVSCWVMPCQGIPCQGMLCWEVLGHAGSFRAL